MFGGGFVMLLPGVLTAHPFSPSGASIAAWVYLVIFGSVGEHLAGRVLIGAGIVVAAVAVVVRADAPPTHRTEPVGEAT